jgi:hypothetical protein
VGSKRLQDSWVPVSLEKVSGRLGRREDVADHLGQDVEAERLVQDRALEQLRGPLGLGSVEIAAHQNDSTQESGPAAYDGKEEGITRNLGESKIEQNEIEVRFGEDLVGGIRMGDGCDLISQVGERPLERAPQGRLVIDDEDPPGHEAT